MSQVANEELLITMLQGSLSNLNNLKIKISRTCIAF